MKTLIHFIVTILFFGCSGSDSSFFAPVAFATADENPEELPIFAIDAQNGLPFMLQQIRGKSLFLLGDASHGTVEFYAFRKLVTRHLIKDFGLRIVVLEAEWDGGKLIDAYITNQLSEDISAREMLRDAFTRWPQWLWANEELVEFVLWLKDFNRSLPVTEKVRCYGMDMQLAVDASLAFLSKQWPSDSVPGQKQTALAEWWQEYASDPILYKERIVAGTAKPNLLATELLELLDNPTVDLRRVLTMLIAAEEYYRTMAVDYYQAWNVRSRHMAKYVTELITNDPTGNGVVVWAHNSHVGDMSGTDGDGTELLNLGLLMRQEIGRENVFILGSASYEGSVLAALHWGDTVQEFTVAPAQEGSIEYLLNSAEWDNPLLFWENKEQSNLWDTPFFHRGIGVVYNPESEFPDNYLTINLSQRYDALVFWKRTRPLRKMMNP